MDGRALVEYLKPELRGHARELAERHGMVPKLGAILVGDNPASMQYVRNKRRLAEDLGFGVEMVKMPSTEATTARLMEEINRLNREPSITGILLQLPLPPGVELHRLFDAIAPQKDIDAVGMHSISGFYRGVWGSFIPCTPRGVLTLLNHYGVTTQGVNATVLGRGDVAGKPMSLILGGRLCNATVTWGHRHTANLAAICRQADILVSCVGADPGDRPFLISADMVKKGGCVVDVGFRRLGPGRFGGDVDFDAVSQVAGWITPSPGGTGPMTVLALMQNLIDAARYRLGLERASYSV